MCPHRYLLFMPNCNPPVGISIHIASQGLLRFEREDPHARDTVVERKVTSKAENQDAQAINTFEFDCHGRSRPQKGNL